MIEKFSKEELELIKKELKEMPKGKHKRTLLVDEFHHLRSFWQRRHTSGINDNWYDIEQHIITLCDLTLCNYDKREKYHKKVGMFRRCNYVQKELETDYKLMVNDIVNIIAEYYKEDMPNAIRS